MAPLYEQPVLVIDPSMHTSVIRDVCIDAAGRWAVTGSEDKTVRVWSLADGQLLRTIRLPAGPGNIGKVYAVAISPDGAMIAAGGWTRWTEADPQEQIYLFDRARGTLVQRIVGLPTSVNKLAFSLDGHSLAAVLSDVGLRIYARERDWAEVARDVDYGEYSGGVDFAADGRLATTGDEGKVRLYTGALEGDIRPTVAIAAPGGHQPRGIAFTPDGTRLAVGYNDSPVVDLLDGRTLVPLPRPDLGGIDGGPLFNVAWSSDGRTLFAGGAYGPTDSSPVLAWSDAGVGARRVLPAGRQSVMSLVPLPEGDLLVGSADPWLARLQADGKARWMHGPLMADFNDQFDNLGVSSDGTRVDFGFEQFGKVPARFDLLTRTLSLDPPIDGRTAAPRQGGLPIVDWHDKARPTLDGQPLQLEVNERSASLAVHPTGDRFVLGADWSLRAFDAKGSSLWKHQVPGPPVWAVNITGDGRLVIAACQDGTIRWHRMADGVELLAFKPLPDRTNWVAWTPEGFYYATPGAFGVLQWQVNRGFDAAADTVPVNVIPSLRRPDALALVLQELDTARALGIADLKAARRDVQIAAGSTKAPGARLHVLTIGISDYGDKAKDLTLKFADRDAQDVANALVNTQEGGLYAEVKLIFLHDATADKPGIFTALASMQNNMATSAGQDFAVVMFSGHGAMIDEEFYFVPYGVDDSIPPRLKASAIAATEFHREISKLAEHGRVLVLLDACRSAGLIGALPAANVLKDVLAASNVTVLTSSTADKVSREDEKWQHGAFTKVFLDALAGDDVDPDHNGAISMTELTAYIAKHLPQLTGGDQQLGLDQRFVGDILVVGS